MRDFNGSKEAFAAALYDLAEKNEKVVGVFPDSIQAMRATDFGKAYPDRTIECGIAEQGAVDVCAGLAASGMIPFLGTYCGFMTMRGCEQMRTFIAYPNLNAKFVGGNAGLLGGGKEGTTHQFYEDLGILSNIPNFTILTPADPYQMYHAVIAAADIQGPVYVRAGSGKEKNLYKKNDPFSIEGITVWREYGNDAVLVSNGYVLDRVLKAADLLRNQGINVTVADINILYGKDPSKIVEVLGRSNQIVTVEDHNINGGVGAYVSRLVCENKPAKVKRIALSTFGESGGSDELLDKYGMSPEAIAQTTREALEK